MESVVLIIHLFLALAIIGLVLLQRSEGGGLGIGGGGGGNFASAKSMGNAMTKATWICAAAFFCTSIALGIMAGTHSASKGGILDALPETPAATVGEPTTEDEAAEEDTNPEETTELPEIEESPPVENPPAVPIAE